MAGLILRISNDQMVEQENSEAEQRRYHEQAVRTDLSAYLQRRWEAHKRHKDRVEKRILKAHRQMNGEYSAEKKAAIQKQGGSLIYMMLTTVKCRAATSWIRDVLMPAGERPWTLKPTPIPELPGDKEQMIQRRVMQDAMQYQQATGQPVTPEMGQEVLKKAREKVLGDMEAEAKDRAERMAELIEDQLQQGGWSDEFDAFIADVVQFPAGILKGPVIRKRRNLEWAEGFEPQVGEVIRPEVYRADPLNIYPEPGSRDIDDGDLIERHRLTRRDLYDLIGVPGYDEEAIRTVLREYSEGALTGWLDNRADDEVSQTAGEESSRYDGSHIDALECWMSIRGTHLSDWGLPIEDLEQEYDACCWMIGTHVIKAEFNPDPLARKPYAKASFEVVAGAFWGRGVPELVEDCQDACNAAARALINNMGLASGPQVVVDSDAIPPGEDITSMYPWKIWQTTWHKGNGSPSAPVHFFQPNPMTGALTDVYEFFSKLADEHSGIPAYSYGVTGVGGAGKTATGLSMLMNAASKGIKSVIRHIDQGGLQPIIHRFWSWNMLFHDDDRVKGDVNVIARGALSLVHKEAVQARRQEFLGMTANPVDMQIMGTEGRAAILRELIKGLDMPSGEVIPDRDELKLRLEQQMAQEQQQPPAPQA